MSNLLNFNVLRALDSDGVPVAGARAFFYVTGSDIPHPVYSDVGCTIQFPQPLSANSAGVLPAVFVTGAAQVRVVMEDPDGEILDGYPLDPVVMTPAGDAAASSVAFSPTAAVPATNVQAAIEMVKASNVQPLNDVGWGVTGNANNIENIDDTGKGSGAYRFDTATNGTFPSGVTKANGGTVLVLRRASGYLYQILQAHSESVPYVRVLNNGVWASWKALLDSATHAASVWNAGADANPKAVSPALVRGAIMSAPAATQSAAGLMSASDKKNVDRYGVAVGDIILSANASPRTDFLPCDGRALSRTTYAALFSALGTTFGAGDGSTTFNIPDMRGRSPIGVGQGSGLTNRARGAYSGFENASLSQANIPAHTHTFSGTTSSAGVHNHGYVGTNLGMGDGRDANRGVDGSQPQYNGLTTDSGAHTHTFSGTTSSIGSGASFSIMNPFAVLNFFIRVI